MLSPILVVLSTRKLDAGHCIRYKNRFYIPITHSRVKAYLKKGMSVMVIESCSGKRFANILDPLFALDEIPKREIYTKNFDKQPVTNPKKTYIPPMSDPWKQASYLAFVAKQKHQQCGANI